MKKGLIWVFVVVGLLLAMSSQAQYCGHSGGSICTNASNHPNPGFYPPDDSLPCVVDGQPYSQVIQIQVPATVTSGGTTYQVQSMKIDSVSNLPCSLCWAMGNSNNTIQGNSTGCMKISGTSFDAPGQYEMRILVDITVIVGIFPYTTTETLNSTGINYFIRVRLPGNTCVQVDSAGPGNTASRAGSISAPVITGGTVLCPGGSTTLTATGSAYYAYAWSNGAFSQSITVTSPGTYRVTVYGNCNLDSAAKTVTIASPVRDTITASGSTTFCAGNSVTLSVPPGSAAYLWSTGATTSSISATTAGTYEVTVTSGQGCTAVSSGMSVSTYPLPTDTITANGPLSFCPGGNVTISGPPGLTYQWSDGSTTQSITTSQSGQFTLIVTNNNNCSAISAPVTVTISPLPNSNITVGGATTFCAGDSVVLSGASGLTYNWSNGATTQSISAMQAGNYILTVSNASNCTAVSSPVNVTLYAPPNDTITVSGPVSLCPGGSVELTAAPGLGYNWSNGSNAQSIAVSSSGNYTVTVTNTNNCSAVSQPVVVTVSPNPDDTVSASGPITFCAGGSVVLSAVNGFNYQWSTGATTQSINVTQMGNYEVTITNGANCSATSSPLLVTVNPAPSNVVTVGGPTSFCVGGSVSLTAAPQLTYLWSNSSTAQAIIVTQTGSYIVTVTNGTNCTAVSSPVNVTVNALPTATITANGPTTFCPGGSVLLTATAGLRYSWTGGATTQSITVSQAGSYSVTVTNNNQCSATVSDTISVNRATLINTQPTNQVTCINGQVTFSVGAAGDNVTYQWQKNGVNISGQQNNTYSIATAAFSDTGSYRVIVSGLCGTDTSHVAALTVAGSLTFSQQPVSQIACVGSRVQFIVVANGSNTTFQWIKNGQNILNATSSSYTINSVAATDTGSYTCFVTSSCGNATSNAATLTVNFPTTGSLSKTICAGSSYSFGGRSLNSAGTYIDTLNNSRGCDSILTLTLGVTAPITHSYNDSVCAGNSYNFNGRQLDTAGVYKDTLVNLAGCDSVVTLHLAIKQTPTSNTNKAICQGDSYNFNGQVLTSAGTYHATLTGANGCDSTAVLHLAVNQPSSHTMSVLICGNSSYNFNGRAISTAGTYTDTLSNSLGCDSVVTLNLAYTSTVNYAYSAAICSGNSYNFNGRIISNPGVYLDTIQTTGGCDSVVTLHLILNQATGSTINSSVCSGATYSFGGRTLSASGTYYDTLRNEHSCDSVVTLNLTVNPPIGTQVHASICSGRTYAFNGQHLSTSGTYTAHLNAANGCDSVVTLQLQVNSFLTSSLSAGICAGNSYSFNGRQLTSTGIYTDTLAAQGGCDSIVTLHLAVAPATRDSIRALICNGGSYNFNGQHLTTAGNYSETLTSTNGCDSVVNLTLQTQPYLTSNITAAICQGTSYNFNGQSLTGSGTYRDTLSAQGGCDSIVTLTLTVNHTSSSTINAAICVGSTYFFNGVQVGATGTYFEALGGTNGCDSIVKLQLLVNSFLTTNLSANICYGSTYTFFGHVLDTTGVYTDTLTAQGGCDSIIIFSLTVNPIITHNLPVTICTAGSYFFNGHQLNTPGIYRDTLVTAGGCDSVLILTLDTASVLTTTINATICSGTTYNFNGRMLSAQGTYTDTLTSLGGCDSIITVNLGLVPSYNFVFNQSICSGETYTFNGQQFSASGTYVDSLNTQHGCDSIVTLVLAVKALPVITWAQNDTICDNDSATQITLAAPTPVGGTLSGDGLSGLVLSIGSNGIYPVTYSYTDSNGCNSSLTKNLLIESCLGVDELNAKIVVLIYPNPANETLIAQTDALIGSHIELVVYDIMGKPVNMPFERQADKIVFNTARLSAGMYLIRFNVNGILISRPFVKAE